jgi:dinuclear metal center YbgI/SA1388 family protein
MAVPLSGVLSVLEQLAPLSFAESWDNVGLLVEPSPCSLAFVSRAVLTIDLDDRVLDEAQALGAQLIIAYHPPIFQGLKALRASAPAERVAVRAVTAGLFVFSPHTALDSAPGGVNDWLLDAFAAPQVTRQPCLPHAVDPRYGAGRSVNLPEPIRLSDAVTRLKHHLGLPQLRVASTPEHAADTALIRSVAVCAGSGGAVFEKTRGFDLLVTGEMRHHDVRAHVQTGSSVVLSEHTHTERGYLSTLASRLRSEMNGEVTFHVSASDREPLSWA